MAEKQPDAREVGFYFTLAQVGTEMVIPAVGGLLVDVYLHTMPWGLLIGAVVGFVGGFYHLIVLVNRHDRADSSKEKRDPQ
jgi:F0F1-type ATP synthase assembly protein I